MTLHTPLLIIGSGPAGYTAAIYAARANIKPVLITGMQEGGQLTKTTEIENFPGFESITGFELMEKMRAQAENLGTILVYDEAVKVNLLKKPFECLCDGGETYTCDALIVATGAAPRMLNLPNEEALIGRGVSYCATCDGAFYRNKKVLVVGGGNTAVEDALYLSKIASEVVLIHRRDSLRAEKVLQERLFSNPKIKICWNTVPLEFKENEKGFSGLRVQNVQTGQEEVLDADGIFIAVGNVPNTNLFKGQLDLDEQGFVVTHDARPFTNIDGVFVAGDVQELYYRQAVTAAAGGCRAAIEAEKFLSL